MGTWCSGCEAGLGEIICEDGSKEFKSPKFLIKSVSSMSDK